MCVCVCVCVCALFQLQTAILTCILPKKPSPPMQLPPELSRIASYCYLLGWLLVAYRPALKRGVAPGPQAPELEGGVAPAYGAVVRVGTPYVVVGGVAPSFGAVVGGVALQWTWDVAPGPGAVVEGGARGVAQSPGAVVEGGVPK